MPSKPIPLPLSHEIRTLETDPNHAFASDGAGRTQPLHVAEATGFEGMLISALVDMTDPEVVYIFDPTL